MSVSKENNSGEVGNNKFQIKVLGGVMAYFKSKRFLSLLFLISALLIACIASMMAVHIRSEWMCDQEASLHPDEQNQSISSQQIVGASVSDAKEMWIVKEYQEQVGIFNINGSLEYVADVYVITLPEADQELLRKGIYVAGQEQLNALMEDYTG